MKRQGVLYVDDCKSISWLVKRFFETRYPTYEVLVAPTATEAMHVLEGRAGKSEFLKAVIVDIQLGPFEDGPSLVHEVRTHYPDMRAIVVSGAITQVDMDRSYRAGAHAVIEKDSNVDRFVNRLFDLVQCPTDLIPAKAAAAL
jgi:DNA-binding NtrC family response regulator